MPTVVRTLRVVLLALSLSALGCHAQAPQGTPLSPELARRVEVLLRSRADLPPGSEVTVGPRTHSDVPGFDAISVVVTADGKSSQPLSFLLSTDGKTLAQFTKYDLPLDPRTMVSIADRPGRGGPVDAPVLIVVFDDLECPFCARSHMELFPALLKRYGDQIHVVYRDFPLSQHPWAMHAAVDVNCLAAQSVPGYWNLVDYIHAHMDDIGGTEKTVAKANDQLDQIVRDEGKRQHADATKLDACIAKQDTSAIEASVKMGTTLGVGATPTLYINGDKVDGALPRDYIFKLIDNALVAAGKTPPPPEAPVAPAKPGS